MSAVPSPSELLDSAVAAARAGADVLRRHFKSGDLRVEHKAENDFVSQADRESEDAVVGEILRRHPEHRVLAEEGGQRSGAGGGEGDCEWIVDPLDGTTNFLRGLPVFCVSVAVRRGGRTLAGAVLDPTRDDLFTASAGGGAAWNGRPMSVSGRQGLAGAFLSTGYPFKAKGALDLYLAIFGDALSVAGGIRRCGSAALDLAYTAAGVYDGFFEFRLSPWDFAAGALLVEEAGGVVSDLEGGDRYPRGGNLLAGGRGVHRDLLAIARRHADEATLDRRVPREAPAPCEPLAMEATVG